VNLNLCFAGLTNTSLVVFRDQELSIHEQLDIARHFGPLHKHATTPVPREPGLEEVHGESDCSKNSVIVNVVLQSSTMMLHDALMLARFRRSSFGTAM
jgi:alpha-ketoglutarate-dependent taurine dioxygenase